MRCVLLVSHVVAALALGSSAQNVSTVDPPTTGPPLPTTSLPPTTVSPTTNTPPVPTETPAPTKPPSPPPTQTPAPATTQPPAPTTQTTAPTTAPTTVSPSDAPTQAPTEPPTEAPTEVPTEAPTEAPLATTAATVTVPDIVETPVAPEVTPIPADFTVPPEPSSSPHLPASKTSAKEPEAMSSLSLILGLSGGAIGLVLLIACVVYHRSYKRRDSTDGFKTPEAVQPYAEVSPSLHRTHNSSLHNSTFNGAFPKRAPSANRTPVHALLSPQNGRSNQALWDVLLGRDTITSDPSPNVQPRYLSSQSSAGTYSESHIGTSFDSSSRAPSNFAVSECSDIYPGSSSLYRISSSLRSNESGDIVEMEL
ncbi:hypothetical protein ACHHYP_04068 [Achlya hypogyna]|uniref:Secreted protein n=1 Tax=Achlya hypogyna TaxID=1202772 RepID=A0A1V9Z2J5_ACHHY|nr:hypothetical protein ACHHYP_04068 [Achlya hypogyna]